MSPCPPAIGGDDIELPGPTLRLAGRSGSTGRSRGDDVVLKRLATGTETACLPAAARTETGAILDGVGLTGPFWELPAGLNSEQ